MGVQQQMNINGDLPRKEIDLTQIATEDTSTGTMDAISGEFRIPAIPCMSQGDKIRLMRGFSGEIASLDGLRKLKALLSPIKYMKNGSDWLVTGDDVQTKAYEEKEIPRERNCDGQCTYEECILDWDECSKDVDFDGNVDTLVASNYQMNIEEIEEVHQLNAKRMDYAVAASSPKLQEFFSQVGIPTHMRKNVVEAIVDEISDVPRVFWEGSMPTFIRQFMNKITFNYADRVCMMLHNRPLYISIFLNNFNCKRTLLDGGASLNIMPMSTFVFVGLNK